MEEKTVIVGLFLAVLAVAVFGVVGLSKQETGAAMLPRYGCWCTLQVTSYYGGSMVSKRQFIDAQRNSMLTTEECQNRCEQYFPTDVYGVIGEPGTN